MRTVRPKPLGAPVTDLPLTAEEGFVLSRIDGRVSLNDLVALTGLEADRIEQIVTKLASHGAVALEPAESSGYLPDPGIDPVGDAFTDVTDGTASLADFAASLGMDPSTFAAAEEAAARAAAERPPPSAPADAESEAELTSSQRMLAAEPSGPIEDEPATEEEASLAADEATAVTTDLNWRQVYETKWHPLPTDVRVTAARTASGADLLALCFDADPRVIASVLANHQIGLDHVRLIAFHHRNATGLEMLSRRQDWLRDVMVERRLLRNPQIGETVLSRVMSPKRVFATYKITIDRDIPELSRAKSRGYLRQKWQTAPPEERADLLVRTEGRCLTIMTGCTFDAKTTQILCGRPINSVLFTQSLAKFAATPPALLAHLMKQPFVRKSPPLKKLLLQHPNMPGDMKRQV